MRGERLEVREEAASHSAREGLPLHVDRTSGEIRSQPPVEQVLTESPIRNLIKRGILPLVGVAGTVEARIVSSRSLSGAPLFLG